jgi:hypothetical protein
MVRVVMTLSLSITVSYNGESIDAILVRLRAADDVQPNVGRQPRRLGDR